MLPGMWWCAELPGEDAAEQLELMRSAFRVIRTVREKHACTQCDAIAGPRAFTAHRAGYRRTGAAGPRAEFKVCRAHPAVPPV